MTRWFNTNFLWKEPNNRQSIGKYKLIKEIGQGASAIVHLGIDIKTHQRVAIKEISKSRLQRQHQMEFLRQSGPAHRKALQDGSSENKKRRLNECDTPIVYEVEILKELPLHKNIIQFIEVLEDDDSIFIVTELADKGVVMDIVPQAVTEPYSEDQCRIIFKQLVDAVDHLHQNHVVHRDIKPQNLMMSNHQVVKLIDFGNATELTKLPYHASKSVGSPAFMAPELLRKVKMENPFESPLISADIWSMGITLYCLVYGHLPFEKPNILDLYNDIQYQSVTHSDSVNPILCDLINKLLEKNPIDRSTIKEIKLHPWMQS